jgi:hypothetical protein
MEGQLSKEIKLEHRRLTLRLRCDAHFTSTSQKERAAESARNFLADSFSWQNDLAFMTRLQELLGLNEPDAANARWKVKRALETGELVTMPDAPSSGLSGSRRTDIPQPRSTVFTPSQLFKGASRITFGTSSFASQKMARLPADDCMAAWNARPGDVLPNGTIAKAIGVPIDRALTLEGIREKLLFGDGPFADAQPFEYQQEALTDDAFDLTGLPFDGEPGWVESGPDQKKQWRMYGAEGTPVVDIDFDDHHGQPNPHAHNWDGKLRDHGWPVSIFPR